VALWQSHQVPRAMLLVVWHPHLLAALLEAPCRAAHSVQGLVLCQHSGPLSSSSTFSSNRRCPALPWQVLGRPMGLAAPRQAQHHTVQVRWEQQRQACQLGTPGQRSKA
jgi:hypothetical protein